MFTKMQKSAIIETLLSHEITDVDDDVEFGFIACGWENNVWISIPKNLLPSTTYTPNNSKLTKAQVIEIRRLLSTTTLTYQKIADIFGVSRQAIHNIAKNKQWRTDSSTEIERSPKITEEIAKEVANLIRSGNTNKQIAEITGLSHMNITKIRAGRVHRDVTKFKEKPFQKKLNAKEVATIRKLANEGKTSHEIADSMNIEYKTVMNVVAGRTYVNF